MNKKEAKIIEAKFKAKLQTMLKTSLLENFNGCYMTIEDKVIMIYKKTKWLKYLLIILKMIKKNNNI